MAFWAFTKRAPNLASAADAATSLSNRACNVDGAITFDLVAINRENTEEEIATMATAGARGREIRCIKWTLSVILEMHYCMMASEWVHR